MLLSYLPVLTAMHEGSGGNGLKSPAVSFGVIVFLHAESRSGASGSAGTNISDGSLSRNYILSSRSKYRTRNFSNTVGLHLCLGCFTIWCTDNPLNQVL